MSHIRANGIAIHYVIEGRQDAPIVMFSNSLLTDYSMWDAQIPALIHKWRVLRYDSRGHGGTEATAAPYSMAMLSADVIALLDALNIERVHFVGLSMGGMIGQRLASEHPERLLSLSLCDTACRMPPPSAWDERVALAQAKGTAAFVEPMTTRWLTQSFREHHPAVLKKLGAMIAQTSVEGMVGCCHAIKTMDHLPLLRSITAPTLVVVGEHDIGTPVAAARTLQEHISDAELVVIDKAAHLVNIEQTEVFNRVLTGFLERASGDER